MIEDFWGIKWIEKTFIRWEWIKTTVMNSKFLCVFFALLSISISVSAQGIDFFKGTWKEALAEAKAQDKMLFVDAYTTWCGPCKRMSKMVFTQKSVGDFFNKHFVSIKLDMEKKDGKSFRKKYPVSAYPTLYYLRSNGKSIKKIVGGRDAAKLVKEAQSVLASVDYSADFKKAYESGDKSYETVLAYVNALNKSNKSSLKVSNDFLRANPNLTQDKLQNFLFAAATEVDSKIFDRMLEHKAAIIKQVGKAVFQLRVQKSAQKTLNKAIEYEDTDLYEQALRAVKKHAKPLFKSFAIDAGMKKAQSDNDFGAYQKFSKKFLKANKDPLKQLEWMKSSISAFPGNKAVVPFLYKNALRVFRKVKDIKLIHGFTKQLISMNMKPEAKKYLQYMKKRTKEADTNKAIQQMMDQFK